jgi:RHS repeat-associated protein
MTNDTTVHSQIPDGLLAGITLLSEKPRHGVASKNPAPKQGINDANSTVAIGLRAGLLLNRVESRYTGKERDAESGLDYFGARYYGSTMGRFMSPDWSSSPTATPYANLQNPQSLNRKRVIFPTGFVVSCGVMMRPWNAGKQSRPIPG